MPKISRQRHDAVSLGHVLEDLGDVTNSLTLLLESMKANGIDTVAVRFDAEMRRALKYLPRFCSDGHDYVRQEIIATGQRYRPKVEAGGDSANGTRQPRATRKKR